MSMKWFTQAFARRWFYIGALILAVLYGFGGLFHIGNILGFGELKWAESPLAWKLGDIWWGTLDIVAVIGIIYKSPVGLIALGLAALSQVVVYGFFPQLFALTDAHLSALRGMVYFNAGVLLVLGTALYVAATTNDR